MLVCVFSNAFCTRDRGCSAHPAFPAPLIGEGKEIDSKPRAIRAARSRSRVGKRSCSKIESHPSSLRSNSETSASSPAVAQYQFETEIDMARPATRQHQFGRCAADGV